jgi:hypothetical protein
MTNFTAALGIYKYNYVRASGGGAVRFFIGREKEFRIVGSFRLFVRLLYTHQRVTPNGFSCVRLLGAGARPLTGGDDRRGEAIYFTVH